MPVNSHINFRKGSASQWTTTNPILTSGEPGFETDTFRLKIGNGSTSWSGLNYLNIVPTGFIGGNNIGIVLGPNGSTATISFTGLFGTAANTFCQGNDSRLSDTRNTTNSLTINNGGAGDASPFTFNGSAARIISYNSIGSPSISGANATGTWNIGISGNAATVTSGVYTNRSITINGTTNQITSSAGAQDLSANRTWTLSLPQDIHSSATPTFGGLTINGVSNTRAAASATAATQIAIFNADPASTTRSLVTRTPAQLLSDIGAYAATNPNGYTANAGTVTSVGGTGTVAGLTLTGTVTTTGSLTLGGTLSTPVSTINDSTTVGQNLVKLTNPSAIRFLRINANNTVDALTDSAFRTAIGAGTSSTTGTVTSVAALTIGTTGTDLSSTVTNGTTTPTITLNVPTASASNRGALSSTDWTTFNNKQNALTNPVTGIGAANHIAYWTSTSGIAHDSNQLVWDSTNNRLGIGTASPGATLDVRGSAVFNEDGADNDFRVEGDTDANLLFVDASTDRVGVGTSTPGYKLQVAGSFGATTKSFRIDHPSKKDYSLEYGSLESPYHGVRLTGRGKVIKGIGIVHLPEYLKDLIHDDESIVVQLTNYKHSKTLYVDSVDLQNDKFIVKADRAKTLGELEFFWTLTGIRKDVDHLIVEKRNI